jgi:hypothetical protein
MKILFECGKTLHTFRFAAMLVYFIILDKEIENETSCRQI